MSEQIIIKESIFEKARKLIREAQDKIIIFSSDNDELNRKILEKEKINILLINLAGKKDFQKQRDSGFNQVLAKIAKEKNVAIGINFDEIIQASQYEKPKILARLKQNIKLCNKNKLKMKFIIQNPENQRDIYDLKSLGAVLGMPTWMTKTI
ncbi:MAG: ribonuclease P/MRP protein subunit RPP1 [archaeon GW2011_AR19]|nr:MAG: ribonuclease P/MRP protein subunit RPP1 [archaeon GW2011_AR19]